MKLYLKQKVFSWKDRFTIYDEYGNDFFYVEGEFLSIGKKLHIYDLQGNEVAYIHQKVLSLLPRYFISIDNVQVAEVVKEITFFKPRYSVKGPDWIVSGDFFAMDYKMSCKNRDIAFVQKKWFSWGDTYELNILDTGDTLVALCTNLIIDAVIDSESNSQAFFGN